MGAITYPLAEIFRSIQGEGYHAGCTAVFVRFAGCNLDCPFCDTDHSEKMRFGAEDIWQRVRGLMEPGDLIVLTGGEPTIHPLIPLIQLFKQGRICIETNGVLWKRLRDIRIVRPDVWITVSPKPQRVSYKALENANEVKVVFDSFPAAVLEKLHSKISSNVLQPGRAYIQPCSGDIQPALKYVMEHPWWKLSLQLHKLMGIR